MHQLCVGEYKIEPKSYILHNFNIIIIIILFIYWNYCVINHIISSCLEIILYIWNKSICITRFHYYCNYFVICFSVRARHLVFRFVFFLVLVHEYRISNQNNLVRFDFYYFSSIYVISVQFFMGLLMCFLKLCNFLTPDVVVDRSRNPKCNR